MAPCSCARNYDFATTTRSEFIGGAEAKATSPLFFPSIARENAEKMRLRAPAQ
jgi:hypothetical protein